MTPKLWKYLILPKAGGTYQQILFFRNTFPGSFSPGNCSQKCVMISQPLLVLSTHPLEPLEVFPEEADGVVRPRYAQLYDALLQDLLDVCNTNIISVYTF